MSKTWKMRKLQVILLVILSGVLLLQSYRLWSLHLQVAQAEEQIFFFEETQALLPKQKTSADVEELIAAVERYYPSGTKQKTGSHLDRIVEAARKRTIDYINTNSIPFQRK